MTIPAISDPRVESELAFSITFHGPFRVARGEASSGADLTVDHLTPLPASSLKGLMRAAATGVLGVPAPWVAAVFGADTAGESPGPTTGGVFDQWCWSDPAIPDGASTFDRAARIRLQPDGTVMDRHLLIGEQCWINTPVSFTVTRMSAVDSIDLAIHRLILRASARAVMALGGQRRRGFGWVSITDTTDWTDADSQALIDLHHRSPSVAFAAAALDGARTVPAVPVAPRTMRRLTYRLHLRSVVAAGAGSELGSGQRGHQVIPGSVIRGALAAAWLRDHQLSAADEQMATLFERDLGVGPAVPVDSRLVPLSVYQEKYPAPNHPTFWADAATSPTDPPLSGIEYGRGWNVPSSSMVRITRTALTPEGTAKTGALFTETCLRSGVVAVGELLVPTAQTEALEWLLRPRTLRVGGRRSTGGMVDWTVPAGPTAEPPPADPDIDGTVLVRCLSPLILVDQFGAPAVDPASVEAALEDAAGEPLTLERQWSRTRTIDGWHTASGLPKVAEWAVESGSVFEVKGLTAVGWDRLARGAGLRRQEGYGRLDLCPASLGETLLLPVIDPAPSTAAPAADASTTTTGQAADRAARTPVAGRPVAPPGNPDAVRDPVPAVDADDGGPPASVIEPAVVEPATSAAPQPPTVDQRVDALLAALGPHDVPDVLKGLANEARRIANFRASGMDAVAAGAARSAVKQAWARQRSEPVQRAITDLLLDDNVSHVRDVVTRRLGDRS